LPDGIFVYEKPKFWYILQGFPIEKFDIFYGYTVNFVAICLIFSDFIYFVAVCYIFPILVNCIKKTLAALPQSCCPLLRPLENDGRSQVFSTLTFNLKFFFRHNVGQGYVDYMYI
jgi:hypothetical protein